MVRDRATTTSRHCPPMPRMARRKSGMLHMHDASRARRERSRRNICDGDSAVCPMVHARLALPHPHSYDVPLPSAPAAQSPVIEQPLRMPARPARLRGPRVQAHCAEQARVTVP